MGSKKRLPQMAGGSASALSLSRPAQASLTLRPAGSLSRPGVTWIISLISGPTTDGPVNARMLMVPRQAQCDALHTKQRVSARAASGQNKKWSPPSPRNPRSAVRP
jgi:hypothetical protein